MGEKLEDRVSQLEQTVEQLQKQLQSQKPASGWISDSIGCFSNDPVFEEIVRLGKEIRDGEAPVTKEP